MKTRKFCARDEDPLLPITSKFDEHSDSVTCSLECCNLMYHLDEVMFTASCMATLLVSQLPLANVDGKAMPVFHLGSVPPTFRAFFICLMVACYASVCSIHARKTRSKIAMFFYAFAIISMTASVLIVLCAAVWEIYKAWFELSFTSSP